ncbi:MAG: hypothetical protein GF401_15875 [Chitinivibrionales bacterium]|nr:hypothetical protein [Chitinivibrionales bacterium]
MQHQYATFYLGDGMFAVNVLLVQEINRNLEITNVDPSPDFVIGLMNLRGQIVTILDLGVRLGLEKQQRGYGSCCVILKTNADIKLLDAINDVNGQTSEDIVGLLVDNVGDMIEVEDSEIEKPPANVNGVESVYLRGVIKRDEQLVALMDMRRILEIS